MSYVIQIFQNSLWNNKLNKYTKDKSLSQEILSYLSNKLVLYTQKFPQF